MERRHAMREDTLRVSGGPFDFAQGVVELDDFLIKETDVHPKFDRL